MRIIRDPLLLIIILASLVLGVISLTRGHEWGDDFASYIMQAQSILDGDTEEFIQRNTFTIYESSFQIGPVAYPWGYPISLIPALMLKGVHPLTLKLPGLFYFAGFLICFFLLIKDRLTRAESLLIVSLFAFNPILIKYLDQILSDIPFLFFVSLALLWITNLGTQQDTWKHVMLGLIIFLAFFVRTTGFILLASFLVHQAIRFYFDQGERRAILLGSIQTAATFVLLWFFTSLIFPDGQGSYLLQLSGLTLDVLFKENIPAYFYIFVQFLDSNPSPGQIYVRIHYVLVFFFLIGAWTRRRADQPLLIFFTLYLIAMLCWPEWQGVRFIFPLLPVFIYFAFQGMKTIIGILSENYRWVGKAMFWAFWLVLLGNLLFVAGSRAYDNLKDHRAINGPFDPFSSDVYNYIRAETPPDSVIIFWKPRAMRLLTNRNTFMSIECERLPLGDYVVISKKAENSQIPPNEIDKCGLPLENVFENRRFIIYAFPK